MSAEDGGPAFPVVVGNQWPEGHQVGHHEWQAYGMSLRDWFATHADEGDLKDQAEIIRSRAMQNGGLSILPDNWRAEARYMHADAMLAARKGTP